MLTQRGKLDLKVFYSWGKSVLENKRDPGFGKVIEWDIPLLDGYAYEFLDNSATEKGSHHYKGIVNPEIIARVDAYDPDAILVFGWSFHSHLKVIRHYSKKKKIIFRGDSTLLDEIPGFKAGLRKVFLKWVYRHIDYALFVGKNNYDYFIKMGLKSDQLIYAPHATDNHRFASDHENMQGKANEYRKSLGIGANDFAFVFAGKLEEKKNVGLLLSVFQESGLAERAHLVIVGNGPQEAELKKTYALNPFIHFMDFMNQSFMPAIYRMADVFVLPSKGPGETWGLALNEAMACSRAVLASDRCGGSADLIENGVNGYVFASGSREELAEKMTLLLDAGKDAASQMGRYSAEKIKSFSFEAICVATESLLLQKNRVPA